MPPQLHPLNEASMNLLKAASLITLSASLVIPALGQTIAINRENKTIAISTTDEATATADIAAITIGFEIYGPDSKSVTAEGGKLSHAILEALRQAGVEDKAIESESQGVERNRNYEEKAKKDEQQTMPYVFNQSWTVSVSPEIASKVINVAVAAGANKSGSIDWRLSDHKALQAKAAENALIKARTVANHMSEGLHVKLGQLIYASNESPNTKLYLYRPKPGLVMETTNASMSSRLVSVPLEIRPQTIREEATVYAVFSIE
jgi:hypothetical protein